MELHLKKETLHYNVWREIWHPNTFSGLYVKGAATVWPSADDSSKQELQNSGSGRGRLSFIPLYHYKVIWECENLTLYYPCMCLWRSKPSTTIGTKEETAPPKKKPHTWWIFKLQRLVSCRLFITGWRRIICSHLVVKGWRHII